MSTLSNSTSVVNSTGGLVEAFEHHQTLEEINAVNQLAATGTALASYAENWVMTG